jgi:hypothetical protein
MRCRRNRDVPLGAPASITFGAWSAHGHTPSEPTPLRPARSGGDAQVLPARVERDALSRITIGTEIRWSAAALVRRGREHRCGAAQRRLVT